MIQTTTITNARECMQTDESVSDDPVFTFSKSKVSALRPSAAAYRRSQGNHLANILNSDLGSSRDRHGEKDESGQGNQDLQQTRQLRFGSVERIGSDDSMKAELGFLSHVPESVPTEQLETVWPRTDFIQIY